MTITLEPIAFVHNTRPVIGDDHWGSVESDIVLADHIPTEAFDNIELFSHLEVIFSFHQLKENAPVVFARHPRDNEAYPKMGLYGQRTKDRPNHIGLTTVRLLGHTGRSIRVGLLDAIDGTPVLDIKPVFREFQPGGAIRQPEWVSALMKSYW